MKPNPGHQHDVSATPLSPQGRILADMFASNGRHDEAAHLMNGHSFGSAVAEARRERRMRVETLLERLRPVLDLSASEWNEIEHDRRDPQALGSAGMNLLAEVLGMDADELRALAAKHLRARREEQRLWAIVTQDAHAFRRRKGAWNRT